MDCALLRSLQFAFLASLVICSSRLWVFVLFPPFWYSKVSLTGPVLSVDIVMLCTIPSNYINMWNRVYDKYQIFRIKLYGGKSTWEKTFICVRTLSTLSTVFAFLTFYLKEDVFHSATIYWRACIKSGKRVFMYLCVMGNDFVIGFWNCSDIVVFFIFICLSSKA